MPDIMGMVYGALNTIFNPILALDPNPTNPALTVLIIAFFVSLITTIANKYLVDQDEMNAIQERNKAFQKELRDAQKRGDGKKIAELQAKQTEMMKDQSAMMSNQFKPMIVTFVPIILIFFWMRTSAITLCGTGANISSEMPPSTGRMSGLTRPFPIMSAPTPRNVFRI